MNWNLRHDPELAVLSHDEVKCLMREAGEAKSVRRASLFGWMLCGLCAAMGSFIGDIYFVGIYGAGVGSGWEAWFLRRYE